MPRTNLTAERRRRRRKIVWRGRRKDIGYWIEKNGEEKDVEKTKGVNMSYRTNVDRKSGDDAIENRLT